MSVLQCDSCRRCSIWEVQDTGASQRRQNPSAVKICLLHNVANAPPTADNARSEFSDTPVERRCSGSRAGAKRPDSNFEESGKALTCHLHGANSGPVSDAAALVLPADHSIRNVKEERLSLFTIAALEGPQVPGPNLDHNFIHLALDALLQCTRSSISEPLHQPPEQRARSASVTNQQSSCEPTAPGDPSMWCIT